jgi:hypothetical protein
MRYKNTSRHKVLIQVGDEIKEIVPNEVFESSERLNYSFVSEVVEEKPKVIRKQAVKKVTKVKLDGSNSTKA